MGTISAQTVNVTNVYGDMQNYLSFAIITAQKSSNSVIFFDEHRKTLYFNNRLRTFDNATKLDMQTVDSVCTYLEHIYVDGCQIREKLNQCYNDMAPKEYFCEKLCGDKLKVKVEPVIENSKLQGVVVFVRLLSWANKIHQIDP